MPRMSYLIRLVISALALWIATLLIGGVQVTTHSTGKEVLTILVVAIIFGIVNAVLRPIIKTVGCAFYVLTLGLISLVVNGLLFLLVSWISGEAGIPFHVQNFWPSAVLGALIVGLVSWLLGIVVPDTAQGK
jgi:putative membrane protein